jgi:hypothetical protein
MLMKSHDADLKVNTAIFDMANAAAQQTKETENEQKKAGEIKANQRETEERRTILHDQNGITKLWVGGKTSVELPCRSKELSHPLSTACEKTFTFFKSTAHDWIISTDLTVDKVNKPMYCRPCSQNKPGNKNKASASTPAADGATAGMDAHRL